MTQEEKQLLLQDLCARLPYGVKCKAYDCINYPYNGDGFIIAIGQNYIETTYSSEEGIFPVGGVLPYLRPMSSMTEEEKNEHFGRTMTIDIVQTSKEVIHWLNKHHFDYRGLIEKGLALEAPEGMYK